MWRRYTYSDNVNDKIRRGKEFSEKLWNSHIEFIGISGSVSYNPQPEDDIDIFLITKNGWLWVEILWAFILRRMMGMGDICLSLSVDRKGALKLFRNLSSLQERDAEHVIPVRGNEFYNTLLLETDPGKNKNRNETSLDHIGQKSEFTFMEMANIFLFFLLYPLQKLKEIRFNSIHISKEPELVYHILIGPNRLILDSEKYRTLSEYVGNYND